MKFPIFSLILNTIFVNAETDCSAVIKQWYGIDCGTEMKCSSSFACNVTLTDDTSTDAHCSQYSCVEPGRCPDGTTYMAFWNNQTGKDVLAGHACTPPEHVPANFSFQCDFDDDGKLQIHALVNNINRHPMGYDDRNYTMISYESWESYLALNFTIVEIFDTSNCYGIEGPNKTTFSVVNSTTCPFTNRGMLYDDMGIPFFVQSVVFGYDDLVHAGTAIRAFGRSFTVHCQISAFDTLFINPAADGARDDQEVIVNTEVTFDIGMYRDDTFSEKMENGDTVDISPDAINPVVYVQVEANLGSNSEGLNMVHIKQCKWSVYQQVDGEWEKNNNTNSFMVNGCARVSDNEYIDLFVGAKDTRTQFANETRTFNVDQFYIYPPKGVNNAKMEIECDVVACSVASFERTDSSAETSFCFLDDECSDRYDILKSNFRTKKVNDGEYPVSEVQHTEKFEIFVNCPGNNCIGGTVPTPVPPPNNSSTTNFLSCLTLFISIYHLLG